MKLLKYIFVVQVLVGSWAKNVVSKKIPMRELAKIKNLWTHWEVVAYNNMSLYYHCYELGTLRCQFDPIELSCHEITFAEYDPIPAISMRAYPKSETSKDAYILPHIGYIIPTPNTEDYVLSIKEQLPKRCKNEIKRYFRTKNDPNGIGDFVFLRFTLRFRILKTDYENYIILSVLEFGPLDEPEIWVLVRLSLDMSTKHRYRNTALNYLNSLNMFSNMKSFKKSKLKVCHRYRQRCVSDCKKIGIFYQTPWVCNAYKSNNANLQFQKISFIILIDILILFIF